MACQRYREEINDAAARFLATESTAQFQAHLHGCPVCRATLETQRRVYAAMDDGLRARVNEDLPVAFAAGVRARIDADAGASLRHLWLIGGLVASTAALVVAFVLTSGQWRGGEKRQDVQVAEQVAPPKTERVTLENKVSSSHVPTIRQKHRQPARTRPFPPQNTSARANVSITEVLVPAGRREAVAQLLDGLRRGKVQGNALLSKREEIDLRPIEIAPLAVNPVEEAKSEFNK